MTSDHNGGGDRFDRIYGQLAGLGKRAGPSTVRDSMPILGNVTTFTVETPCALTPKRSCRLATLDQDDRPTRLQLRRERRSL